MRKALSLVIILALLCTPQAAAIATDPALAASTLSEREVVVSNARNRSDWQLTSAELNAPTEELVKSILESPYILGLFASSSSDHDTYASMRIYFNGLPELESREDASSVMLSLFEELTLSKTEWDSLDQLYLSGLLSKPIYANRLTDSEKETYDLLVAIHKSQVKAEATGEGSRYLDGFKLGKIEYTRSSTNGYTTSGEIVPLYIADDDFTKTQKQSDESAVTIKARDRSSWQLSEAELNAPTEELVRSILESPYLLDFFHSSSFENDPYTSMTTYFNGLPELESREDASSVMLSLLEELTATPKEPGNLDQSYLHALLSEPIYFNRLTDSEKTTYIRLHINRTDIVIIGSPGVDPGLVFAERYHCTFTVNNSAAHTRTYSTYGWSVTEAHTPNVKTGNCIGCGFKGPFSYAIG